MTVFMTHLSLSLSLHDRLHDSLSLSLHDRLHVSLSPVPSLGQSVDRDAPIQSEEQIPVVTTRTKSCGLYIYMYNVIIIKYILTIVKSVQVCLYNHVLCILQYFILHIHVHVLV